MPKMPLNVEEGLKPNENLLSAETPEQVARRHELTKTIQEAITAYAATRNVPANELITASANALLNLLVPIGPMPVITIANFIAGTAGAAYMLLPGYEVLFAQLQAAHAESAMRAGQGAARKDH